jgi:hypothetical protein
MKLGVLSLVLMLALSVGIASGQAATDVTRSTLYDLDGATVSVASDGCTWTSTNIRFSKANMLAPVFAESVPSL